MQHLLDMTYTPGDSIYRALGRVTQRIAVGEIPGDARQFFFGARLVALVKADLSLRPIACGEVLRRLAGKLLCAAVKKEVATLLLADGRVGVAIPGGSEGMTDAAKRIVGTWRR